MQRLVFILSYPFLWFIAALPFRLFYLFSDVVFFIVYHLAGYRRKVVRSNLKLVFPDISKTDLKHTERAFYRHMCDVFLETIKTMKISKTDFEKRFKVTNSHLVHAVEQYRSVVVLIPHYGNWEWSIAISNNVNIQCYAVYQKIQNRHFDALIRRIRAKWNSVLIHQKETVRTIIRNEKNGTKALYGIVSDQSPQRHRTRYWRPFMGITVPVFENPEQIARKFDLAVFFAKISKVKRGYYELEFVPISEQASQTAEHEITDKFIELTEDCIRQDPSLYLWTHRRWKHKDNVPSEFLEISKSSLDETG